MSSRKIILTRCYKDRPLQHRGSKIQASVTCYTGYVKILYSRRLLERSITEGDNPVGEMQNFRSVCILSTAVHVKFRRNLSRLCDKAKYQQ